MVTRRNQSSSLCVEPWTWPGYGISPRGDEVFCPCVVSFDSTYCLINVMNLLNIFSFYQLNAHMSL